VRAMIGFKNMGRQTVWLLMFDGFCGAIIGVGCSQSLLQVLDDNHAVGVDISIHVVMANGAAQMIQPLLAGYARDRGVPPRYILGLSAAFVATVRERERERERELAS
jgi:hypothetical protein